MFIRVFGQGTARGFTLVELLVVIAVIGMLSSIILTSLANARNKGADAAVKSNLRTTMTQASLYFDANNGSYGTAFSVAACPGSGATMFYADATIRSAISAAANAGGAVTRCATDGTNYAISVQLKSSTNHWCVDSSGASKSISNVAWTGNACP